MSSNPHQNMPNPQTSTLQPGLHTSPLAQRGQAFMSKRLTNQYGDSSLTPISKSALSIANVG